MRRIIKIIATALVIVFVAIAGHLLWLSGLDGGETFPKDTFLDSVSNKTALIVVAHDDDAIGCAGTITELTKKGWNIHFLAFYGDWRKQDNPLRKQEVEVVSKIQNLQRIHLVDFSIQKFDTVKEPWRPIPYSKFPDYLKVDSLRLIIANAIRQHKPSVLFTLDNIIGGYGHPEHVCVSQSAIDACRESGGASVEKIYQAVFPRTLNENVLRNNPAFIAAKKVYNVVGSPDPTVEVDIVNSSSEKKEVMLAYKSQERNLKKIWPYYKVYPHWIYFRIFDKEHFNVITMRELPKNQQ
jgi:N-acetylglucosamine malate deacetylase 2